MNRNCPLCGSPDTENLLTGSDLTLYHQCSACGYIFRDRAFCLSETEEKKRYLLHNNSPSNQGYIKWINKFLDFIFSEPLPEGSRILDFGSGPEPVMAQIMKESGYDVFTEDPFFSPERPGGFFHLITSLEVFEHLSKPSDTLYYLASRLSAGGRLCISTEFLPSNPEAFDAWTYRHDETHIGFFSERGLTEAAGRAGLGKEYSDGVRYICFRLAHRGSSC